MSIEVTCDCGRVYVLPEDKEGRKLQCRKCGAVMTVRRDAVPGTAGTFRLVGEESDEATKGAPPKPVAPPKAPTKRFVLRRCPKCGFQDDPAIVICVRCGLDFREPADAPPPPAAEPTKSALRIKAEVAKVERALDEQVARVETLGKLSFLPLAGVVPGIGALFLSFMVDDTRGLPAPSRKGLENRIGVARLMAAATLILWLGLVGFYVFLFRPQQKLEVRERLASLCQAHLDALGKALRETRGKGRFPAEAKRTLAEGLRSLASDTEFGDAALSCPLLGGEPYGLDQGLAAIVSTTNDEYLIAWDSAPHAEPDGGWKRYALRADGRVEEFRTTPSFEKARSRPSEKAPTVTVGGGQGETHRPPPGPAPEPGFEAKKAALMAWARELDAADPGLEKRISAEELKEKVGLPPLDLAIQVMRAADDFVRRAAVRVEARLDLPGPEMLRVASELEKDADGDTKLVLVRALQRAGAPAWLERAGALAIEQLPPVSDQALAMVAREAKTGRDGLKRVLLVARDRRELTKAAEDQPIFVLPAETYGDATDLLDDKDVGREAAALLSRGGPEVEAALDGVFKRTDPRIRELAFKALRSSLAWRDAGFAPWHVRFQAETDRSVRATALESMLDSVDTEVVKRALESLREGAGDRLGIVAKKFLGMAQGKEQLTELVRELDHAGPSRDEVVTELKRTPRILDDTVAEVLAQKGPFLEAGGQEAAIGLAALRFDDTAHRFLVREATSSSSTSAREAALKALYDGSKLSEKVRVEAQDAFAARLPKETDAVVRGQLFLLLTRIDYRCTQVLTALESLAKKSSESQNVRERSVEVMETSTDPKAFSILVELVDVVPPRIRLALTVALKDLLGSAQQPGTSPEWRKILHQVEPDLKRRLKEREERELADFRDRQQRVDDRLRELRGARRP